MSSQKLELIWNRAESTTISAMFQMSSSFWLLIDLPVVAGSVSLYLKMKSVQSLILVLKNFTISMPIHLGLFQIFSPQQKLVNYISLERVMLYSWSRQVVKLKRFGKTVPSTRLFQMSILYFSFVASNENLDSWELNRFERILRKWIREQHFSTH